MLKQSLQVIALIISLLSPPIRCHGAQLVAPATRQANESIQCSVLETFEDERLGVKTIIFHQENKADGPRLGSFLRAHSGKEMELQTATGQRCRATVFRVTNCFGRGLVMIPAGKLKLDTHEGFTLRVP